MVSREESSKTVGTGDTARLQPVTSQYSIGDPFEMVLAAQNYFGDKQFYGSKKQSIHQSVSDYEVHAKQLAITEQQKIVYFVNIFYGPAREFSFVHCPKNMSLTNWLLSRPANTILRTSPCCTI